MTGPALADCDLAAPDAKAAGPGCAHAWMDKNLRLNDIVTVGTHNSYKAKIPDKIMALIRMGKPAVADGLDYAHRPLGEQLDSGARAIEIDVVYDPKGGLYAHPAGAKMTGEVMPDDWTAAMSAPGFKVLHVQDLDFHTVCITFVACLKDLKTWSDAHPDHVPILVTMNAKDDAIPMPGSVTPLKFDAAAYDALEAEILSVFPREALVTPDSVRGDAATLRDAILTKGWPTLGETRGKFIFALDEHGDKIKPFLDGHPSLKGRVMFVDAPIDSPEAAFLVLNEVTDIPAIRDAVHRNFLVRTRADADTVEARGNDTTRRDKALASGAQYVSTDYMEPDTRLSGYTARMPDGVIAACNPERRPERCAGMPVE
ncbi:MAG: phosphatidylinositol-specific phospholipase C1-like protein [Proteobacteria bacterium]|nr:phosphatidylinositol-specific phospholipase C1-like protein [Pseudomonadota bacterium]